MSTSLISILNMSQHSIANNQAALNVVSNNISNMNTTGYSKQSVAFSSIPAYNSYNYCSSIGSLQIGNGAQLVAINRNRAQWLDNYFREQYTEYGYYNQIGSMTNNIENLMNNELSSTGLQQKLSDFFSASQALTTDPTNNAYRIAFVEAAEDVANMLNSMSSSLQSMREQAVGTIGDPDSFDKSQIKMSVDELNNKLAQLAEINTEISKSMAGGSANNDLLDQRDVLLDEISQAMPLTITTNTNGTVNVHLGNKVLVEGGEQKLQLKAVQTDDENNPVAIQLLDMEENTVKTRLSRGRSKFRELFQYFNNLTGSFPTGCNNNNIHICVTACCMLENSFSGTKGTGNTICPAFGNREKCIDKPDLRDHRLIRHHTLLI